MSFPYKNPTSVDSLGGPQSVAREQNFGTNFSVLQTGGYMEVYNLSDLIFTIPSSNGEVLLSANTIPVRYTKGTGTLFSPNNITLNSDNISSGRRRLGMLVYVHETDKVYQYVIPNYDTLWAGLTGLTGLSAITPTDHTTVINNRSPQGQSFINAWIDSSIEGVSGVTRENARWRIFWGTDWQVTGGTIDYNSTGDLSLNSNSGNTVTISGLKTITGGTFFSGTSTLELYNNLGDTISVTGFTGGSGGTSGSSGSSGTSGSSGSSGTSGSSGSSGTSGSSGSSGTSGSSGSSGTSGSSGSSGTSGSSGSSGTSGSSGSSGTSGSSGSSGTSGSSGSSGTSGNSFTGGTVTYDSNGRLVLESENSLDNINVDGFKTITGGTYLSATTTLELYNNLSDTIQITGFTTGGGDISVSANTGLGIIDPNTLYTIYNSNLSADLEMNEDVGGLDAGTRVEDLTGKTLVQLFNDILFPTALPTYTKPTITLQGLSSQTLEVGTTKSIVISGYGDKNDAGDFTSIRVRTGTTAPNVDVVIDNSPTESSIANIPDQFGFTNPNNPNARFTSTQLSYTLTIPEPSLGEMASTVMYDAEGDCNAGLPKLDNKGNTDTRTAGVTENTPQQARTNLNSDDVTITGVYPYWYGTSSTQPTISTIQDAISGGTANKSSITNDQDGTLTITFNANEEYCWFAHFEEYEQKRSFFVTDINKEDFCSTCLFNTFVTGSIDSPDGYWSGVNYKIYITNLKTTTTSFGAMQLKTNTV